MLRLEGKVALVTGASKGIGAGIATTATEASVNHDVIALGDGQPAFVPPLDGAHESKETVSAWSEAGTVLNVVR